MAAMKDAYNRLLSRFRRKKSSTSEEEELNINAVKEPTTKTIVEVNNNNKAQISITVSEPPRTAGVLYRKPTLRSKLSVPRPRSATFIHLVQSTFYTRSNSYGDAGDDTAAVKLYNKNERLRKLKKHKSRRRAMTEIRLSERRLMPIEAFSSRLNDYNTYYQGRPEELRQRQNRKGELVIDGLLNIYWGLRSSIRLQVADDVKIRPRIEEIKEFDSKQSDSPKNNVATPAQLEDGSYYTLRNTSKLTKANTRHRLDDARRTAMRKKPPSGCYYVRSIISVVACLSAALYARCLQPLLPWVCAYAECADVSFCLPIT